ncbi:RDD family protein [Bacillaceae bacterium Marseille-Q3522]|nr:RDD family protein [Bacillaceae bacterium Marseille-Q3522]
MNIQGEKAAETNEYGGFWLRFVANLIDSMILSFGLSIIFYIIILFFMIISEDAAYVLTNLEYYEEYYMTEAEAWAVISFFFKVIIVCSITGWIVSAAYFAGLECSSLQASVGKKLLDLKVTNLEGNRISFWHGIGRFAAKSLSSFLLCIGYIMIAFNPKKQGLHDAIAGTLVVKR